MRVKIGGDSRAHAQPAGEVMTMAKPKTELGQRCPPPPYTRWDQRGKPVLLSYLKLINGKRLCLSLETEDLDIARRHMRLLVAMLLAEGRLSPDSGAAEVYGPEGARRPRLDDVDTEIRRLKALSEADFGSEALATAKRWGRPVGIIHHLAGRKPALSAGTYRTRRMRARKRGQRMPMGDTWEHRPQGGKYFGWNGKVLTARLQMGGRPWQWPLKGIDEEKAEALMGPVRVARERLHQAAIEELNCELGTIAAVDAAVARAGARAELARAIITAGGPEKLAEFVMKGSQEEVGTAIPQRAAAFTAGPSATLSATRRRQAAEKQCKQLLIERYQAYLRDGKLPRHKEHGGALWRRIVDEGVKFGLVNPLLGSEVGRLLFHGQITEVEAAAAAQVAEIYARHEQAQGLRRSVASPSYMIGIDGADFDEEGAEHIRRARRAKREFDELQKAIPTSRARAVLEQLCVDDQPIGPTNLMDCRILLRRLAVKFRIV
jgi:hypothetical protein